MPKSTISTQANEIKPSADLEKRSRRTFPADYKLDIIRQANACKHGELGALLRREGLYSNQLSQWRRELAQGGVTALSKSAPGPVAKNTPEQRRIEQLQKQVARLQKQISIKDDCLLLQKKALDMLEQMDNEDMP